MSGCSATVLDGDDDLPHRVRRAPIALALLLSLAAHSAVLTSLQHFAAPPGGSGIAGHSAPTISALLVATDKQVAPDSSSPAAPSQAAASQAPKRPQAKHAGTAAPGMPLATYFYAKNEVDRPATAINDVVLRYPRRAHAEGIHGTVILEVFIDAGGSVVRTRVVEALPEGVFEQAAQEAVGQLRYRPALKDHTAVRSRRLVQVVFDPDPPLVPPQERFAAGHADSNQAITGHGKAARP